MRQAVTSSTPASAAMGIRPISGASTSTLSSSTPACTKLIMRVRPPLFTPTLVRAIAAVAGTPPKKGITIFPMPWPISSWLLSRGLPVIVAPTAPHSRLSIPPSAAIEIAAGSRSVSAPQGMLPSVSRLSSRIVRGMSPIIGTCQPATTATIAAKISPTSEPGMLLLMRGASSIVAITMPPSARACQSGTTRWVT